MPSLSEVLYWGFLGSPILAFLVFLVKVLALSLMPAYGGLYNKIMGTMFAVVIMTAVTEAIFVSAFLAATSGAWKCSTAAIPLLFTVTIWRIFASLCKSQRRSESRLA